MHLIIKSSNENKSDCDVFLSSLLTDGSFLCRHDEAQLFGGVGLSLLPQQRPQGAPQNERDAAAGHCGVARRLRGPAVGCQLHQQGQEGREVGLQPGAAQGGDQDHTGLRRRRRRRKRRKRRRKRKEEEEEEEEEEERRRKRRRRRRSHYSESSSSNPTVSTVNYLCDADSDVLADRARPLQHVPAGSEETSPAPQEAPRQQIHHLLQGAPTTPTLSGGCWEKRERGGKAAGD